MWLTSVLQTQLAFKKTGSISLWPSCAAQDAGSGCRMWLKGLGLSGCSGNIAAISLCMQTLRAVSVSPRQGDAGVGGGG